MSSILQENQKHAKNIDTVPMIYIIGSSNNLKIIMLCQPLELLPYYGIYLLQSDVFGRLQQKHQDSVFLYHLPV